MVLGRPHLGCGRACPVSALTSAIFAQVHLVYPSLIGTFVLTVCAWRRIPVYCSHHVEMNMFAYKLVPIRPESLHGRARKRARWVASFGLKMWGSARFAAFNVHLSSINCIICN